MPFCSQELTCMILKGDEDKFVSPFCLAQRILMEIFQALNLMSPQQIWIGLLAQIDAEETRHDDEKMLQEFGGEEGQL